MGEALRFLDVRRKFASESRSAEGSSILTMLLIIYLSISRRVFTFSFEHSFDFVYRAVVFPPLHIIARGFHFWRMTRRRLFRLFINARFPPVPIISARMNYITVYYSWPHAMEIFALLCAELEQRELAWTMANNGASQKLGFELNFWVNARIRVRENLCNEGGTCS